MLEARHTHRLGDSLAVELPALTRAALVRIQVPQPNLNARYINRLSITAGYELPRSLLSYIEHIAQNNERYGEQPQKTKLNISEAFPGLNRYGRALGCGFLRHFNGRPLRDRRIAQAKTYRHILETFRQNARLGMSKAAIGFQFTKHSQLIERLRHKTAPPA